MKKIFSIIASALLIVSCADRSKDVDTPFQAGQKVTLCASIASSEDAANAPQRVSGKDSDPGSTTSVINLIWDEGDKVLVKVGDKSSVFTLTSGAGTNEGSFYGEMPGEGSSYDVVYPADYSDDVLAEQTYVENGFGRGLMKMSTKTAGNIEDGFVMSADNAMLGLQLTGNDELGKIVLTNPADSKTYTLTCTGVKLTSEAKVFYIVVPAGEWANGFVVDVYANDDTRIGILKKASSATFKASTSMAMPTKGVTARYLSICNGRRLVFAHGNLQYHPKNQEWRFAESQLDYIGVENTHANFINPSYDGWLDLFGWSTDNSNFGLSANSGDYAGGDFVDWGKNTISGYAPNTWRTMTKDEWEYLITNRPNASSLLGVAQVNGVNGLILLPDNWICPAGITFKPGFNVKYLYAEYQTFTADQWLQFEEAGAIFLPAAGIRRLTKDVSNETQFSRIWSATGYDNNNAYYLYFLTDKAYMNTTNRSHGHSVRLVRNL